MTTEYRIEYSIQRQTPDDDDFTEIGFGSSGAWDSVDQAAYMLGSDVSHGAWETRPGMPDPAAHAADADTSDWYDDSGPEVDADVSR
jgi:hypothetical protein